MMARKAKDQREKEHLHWQETFRVFTTPRYFITNIMGPPLMLSMQKITILLENTAIQEDFLITYYVFTTKKNIFTGKKLFESSPPLGTL